MTDREWGAALPVVVALPALVAGRYLATVALVGLGYAWLAKIRLSSEASPPECDHDHCERAGTQRVRDGWICRECLGFERVAGGRERYVTGSTAEVMQ